ncbi:hypothetical protein DEU56DRAFT_917449 [Suillus clintonianus]|uniref:uncharacterized protein n=1 Tax=Suillus clintonianus TaxID=1904413 RepID=UPI001B882AEE|nr:uncharacterized protein DEU56DRAFT_920328 [Suillus clintonianus]XP_041203657.1 uncharacterized protein DEU56DRAFT_917449 [Suillus clintonianus]KAG2109522.1 hypothetical protein DEU56DRAFT_920328 [Suillus clintonianus]KAG2123488.1 hypothetical protein DEU56DRAFT_917449 [Suillus clintonianus]
MSNIISASLSMSRSPLKTYFLEIEHAENGLRLWLQNLGIRILPDSLYISASVLFESVDPHDLIALLDMSIKELATQTQLQQEDSSTILFLQRGTCLMEERMYRAQMEVSLFSKAMANLCEKLNTTTNSTNSPASCLASKTLPMDAAGYEGVDEEFTSVKFDCSKRIQTTRSKCMTWLSACRKASLLTSSHFNDTTKPGESILYLPSYLKARVDDEACRAYANACFAEINMPLGIGTDKSDINSFKAASKSLDELKHDFRIMYLKKQRAQSEVDMLSEAIARSVGGASSASATTIESPLPDDDWFDDWNSTSSLSSDSAHLRSSIDRAVASRYRGWPWVSFAVRAGPSSYTHLCSHILSNALTSNHLPKYDSKANQAFATRLASVLQPGDLVWVRDYHLLLVPRMLRNAMHSGAGHRSFRAHAFPEF